jgi:hypothetical protein
VSWFGSRKQSSSGPPSGAWWGQVTTALANLQMTVTAMAGNVSKILMSEQQIQTDVATISAMFDDVATQTASLVSDVDALKTQLASGTPVDTTQLDALAARAAGVQSALDTATTNVTSLASPPPAAPAT